MQVNIRPRPMDFWYFTVITFCRDPGGSLGLGISGDGRFASEKNPRLQGTFERVVSLPNVAGGVSWYFFKLVFEKMGFLGDFFTQK